MADLGDLRSRVEADPALGEKLRAAHSIDDVVAALGTSGAGISKAELIKSEARRVLDYSDAELEAADISVRYTTNTLGGCVTWVMGCCG